jgi:hypothetical protein
VLNLKYDGLLSSFAFKFNLRRYNEVVELRQPLTPAIRRIQEAIVEVMDACMKELRQGLTLVHFRLNVSAFNGDGGAFGGCLGGVLGVSRILRGPQGVCFVRNGSG